MADRQQRAPMFYCYECNAEMRPLMMPDPHCASCNGTFVEEIPSEPSQEPSHTDDDPRHFQVDPLAAFGGGGGGGADGSPGLPGGLPPGGDPVIHLMNALMGGLAGVSVPPPGVGAFSGAASPPGTAPSSRTTIRFDMSNGRGRMFFTSGGSAGSPGPGLGNVLGGGLPTSGSVGSGSATPGSGSQANRGPISPMEGLLSILMGRPMGATGGTGPLGDYVWDQQGLDEIITQLMEQSQGQRPVPAPEDMIKSFPKTTVTADSPLVEKECAVCKDTFEPSPSPVVTLPCSDNQKYRHTFHEDCIVPWLEQNGTCPVCRHAFVPQPQHPGPAPASPITEMPPRRNSNGQAEDSNPSGSSSSTPGPLESAASGIRHGVAGLINLFTGQHQGSGSNSPQRPAAARRESNSSQSQTRARGRRNTPPGGWDHTSD